MQTETLSNYQVISRVTGLIEFEGNYTDCKKYFNEIGFDLSIKKSDEPLFDEDGNYDVIESN